MKGSDIPDLVREGIQIRTDKNPYALMHNKFVIVDEKILITGSYNWTAQATKMNQENIIILENDEMAKKFLAEFDTLWKKFEPQNLGEKYGKDIKRTKLYIRYLSNLKKQEELKQQEEDEEEDESSGSKSKSIISSSKKISKKKKGSNIPLIPKYDRPNIPEMISKKEEPQSKVKSVIFLMKYNFRDFWPFLKFYSS